ncbi:MAG: ferritin family protein [Planctomycetota bacterium]|jgi:rubrerythrin
MATVNTVDEIIEFAITREAEANQLYVYMASHMTNPEMRQVCEDFAKEELEHKAKLELELMKAGKVVVDFNISDYVMEAGDPIDMRYEDLLIFAIKKEDKAVNFYRDLAKIIPSKESREILLSLVQEETEHRKRFESEYEEFLKEI